MFAHNSNLSGPGPGTAIGFSGHSTLVQHIFIQQAQILKSFNSASDNLHNNPENPLIL